MKELKIITVCIIVAIFAKLTIAVVNGVQKSKAKKANAQTEIKK